MWKAQSAIGCKAEQGRTAKYEYVEIPGVRSFGCKLAIRYREKDASYRLPRLWKWNTTPLLAYQTEKAIRFQTQHENFGTELDKKHSER